jgi:hypothetical protein
LPFYFPNPTKNYAALFGSYRNTELKLNDLEGYGEFTEYAKTNEKCAEYFSIPGLDNKYRSGFIITHAEQMLLSLIERYILVYDLAWDDEKFWDVYKPLEAAIHFEDLPLSVVVPICFICFEGEEYNISESVSIKRFSNNFNRARILIDHYGASVHEKVVDCASHGIFLKNFTMKNAGAFLHRDTPTQPEVYPKDDIDTLFSAIRIATGYDTGYAQMLSRLGGRSPTRRIFRHCKASRSGDIRAISIISDG